MVDAWFIQIEVGLGLKVMMVDAWFIQIAAGLGRKVTMENELSIRIEVGLGQRVPMVGVSFTRIAAGLGRKIAMVDGFLTGRLAKGQVSVSCFAQKFLVALMRWKTSSYCWSRWGFTPALGDSRSLWWCRFGVAIAWGQT